MLLKITAQAKQSQNQQQQMKGKQMQSSPLTTGGSSIGSGGGGGVQGAASKPPEPPKESFARRYKFVWPLLLTVNVAVGAYLFMRTKKKDVVEEEAPDAALSPTHMPTPTVAEQPLPSVAIVEPVKLREPIPENQQRELLKWILEEKRKVKPKDPEEKKRIDEEKAVLKHFIRSKSIPTF